MGRDCGGNCELTLSAAVADGASGSVSTAVGSYFTERISLKYRSDG